MERLVKLSVSILDTKPSNLPTYKYQIVHELKTYNYTVHSENKYRRFRIINLSKKVKCN